MDKNVLSIQHMENLSICCMEIKFSFIQHMDKLSICCMDKNFFSIQHIDTLSICCMENYITIVHFFEPTE